jgi:hypothetical protein
MYLSSMVALRLSYLIAVALPLSLSSASSAAAYDDEVSDCPALFDAHLVDEYFSQWAYFLERQGFGPRLISCVDDPTASDGEMLTAIHFLTANPNAFRYGILTSSGPIHPFLATMFSSVPYAHYPLILENGPVCGAFFSIPEHDLRSYASCRWEILRSATWRKHCSSPFERLDR